MPKTLKDIEFDMTISATKGKKLIKPVCRGDLRKEAIKWIENTENITSLIDDREKNEKRKYLIAWIRMFFNLGEK